MLVGLVQRFAKEPVEKVSLLVRHGLLAVPVTCHLLGADHEFAGDGRLEGQAVDAGVRHLLAADLQLSKTVAELWSSA